MKREALILASMLVMLAVLLIWKLRQEPVLPAAVVERNSPLLVDRPAAVRMSSSEELKSREAASELMPQEAVQDEEDLPLPVVPTARGPLGRVVDDLGDPVARFEVRARLATGLANVKDRATVDAISLLALDQEGHFDLGRLWGGAWVLTAQGADDARSAPSIAEIPLKGDAPVLVLPRGAFVRGRVEAPSGDPVAGAAIHVGYAGARLPRTHGPREAEPRTHSDALGRFELSGVNPGTVLAVATLNGYCDSEWTEFQVGPAETTSIVLRLGLGGRIVGEVDPSQGVVSGRDIGLFSFRGTTGWRTTRSDAQGRFTIDSVIPQKYIIELRPAGTPGRGTTLPDGVRKAITVKEGESTQVFFGSQHLPIVVHGRVHTATMPLGGVEVRATRTGSDGGPKSRTQSDESGTFELEVEEPGPYSFGVRAVGGSYRSVERTIEESPSVEVDLELPSSSISGTIVSPEGTGLEHIPVTLVRSLREGEDERTTIGKRLQEVRSNSAGRFEFLFLEPGNYTLRAPDGYHGDSPRPRFPHGLAILKDLGVEHEAIPPLTIRLGPEGWILGRVFDTEGKAVADAAIQVFDASNVPLMASWSIRTDVTGSFHMESVPPGTYTAAALKSGRQGRSRAFDVEAGKYTEVRVELP